MPVLLHDQLELELRQNKAAKLVADARCKPAWPVKVAEGLLNLGLRCTRADTSERPVTADVLHTLEDLLTADGGDTQFGSLLPTGGSISAGFTCQMCEERPRDAALQICGCAVVCAECAETLKRSGGDCPYCRREVSGWVTAPRVIVIPPPAVDPDPSKRSSPVVPDPDPDPEPVVLDIRGRAAPADEAGFDWSLHPGGLSITQFLKSSQFKPGCSVLLRSDPEGGVFNECVVLEKEMEVHFFGQPGAAIVGLPGRPALVSLAARATICGLSLQVAGADAAKYHAVVITEGGLHVRNCDVGAGGIGIRASSDNCSPVIEGTTIHGSSLSGVVFYKNARGTLVDCDLSQNSPSCINVWAGACPIISKCRMRDSFVGVSVSGVGAGGRFDVCTISCQIGCGFVVEGGADPLVTTCTFEGNRGGGLAVSGAGTTGRYIRCSISASGGPGIDVSNRANPYVENSDFRGGQASGVLVRDRAQGSFSRCVVTDNGRSGFEIDSGGEPAVTCCHISANRGQAFWVWEGGSDAKVAADNDLREQEGGGGAPSAAALPGSPPPVGGPGGLPDSRYVVCDVEVEPGDSGAALAAAVAQCPLGGTIRLLPGRYNLSKPWVLDRNVHVFGGASHGRAHLVQRGGCSIAVVSAEKATLQEVDLSWEGATCDAIDVVSGGVRLRSCAFLGAAAGAPWAAVAVHAGAFPSLELCTLKGLPCSGVFFHPGGCGILQENTIAANYGVGVFVAPRDAALGPEYRGIALFSNVVSDNLAGVVDRSQRSRQKKCSVASNRAANSLTSAEQGSIFGLPGLNAFNAVSPSDRAALADLERRAALRCSPAVAVPEGRAAPGERCEAAAAAYEALLRAKDGIAADEATRAAAAAEKLAAERAARTAEAWASCCAGTRSCALFTAQAVFYPLYYLGLAAWLILKKIGAGVGACLVRVGPKGWLVLSLLFIALFTGVFLGCGLFGVCRGSRGMYSCGDVAHGRVQRCPPGMRLDGTLCPANTAWRYHSDGVLFNCFCPDDYDYKG